MNKRLFGCGLGRPLWVLLWSVGVWSISASAEPFRGGELLSYFGAGCTTAGDWTKVALGQAQALARALESMQADENCKSVAATISELGLIQARLTDMAQINSDTKALERLKAREQELKLQLDATTDAEERATLIDALKQIQLSKADLIGDGNGEKKIQSDQHVALIVQTVASTNSLLRQSVANQACLLRRPAILAEIAALTGSIASAASVVNPALSLGLAGGTELLGSIVDYARKGSIARKIRKIDEAIAAKAYMCALESLSLDWCKTQDALSILKFKDDAEHLPPSNPASPLISGVKLVDREIPSLLNWLQLVKNGLANPSTPAEADRIVAVYKREQMYKTSAVKVPTIVQDQEVLFAATPDVKDKWTIVRMVVTQIVSNLVSGGISVGPSGPEPSNPFSEIFNSDYAPYYLLGIPENLVPKSYGSTKSFSQFDPFSEWPAGMNSFTPNLDVVKSQFDLWRGRVADRIERELMNVLHPDSLRTVDEALTRTNPWKISAMDGLRAIRSFLRNYQPPRIGDHPAFARMYSSTISILDRVEEQVNNVVKNDEADPATALGQIYDDAQLKDGVVFLKGRIEMALRLALFDLFTSSNPQDQNTAAQFLAASDMLEMLYAIQGTKSTALIKRDLSGARAILLETLQNFGDVFAKNIRRVLRNFVEKEQNVPGASGREFHSQRAELCLKLLAIPQWPRKIPAQYCLGLKLEASETGGPDSVTIDTTLLAADHDRRACSFRDYLRKSQIFENGLGATGHAKGVN